MRQLVRSVSLLVVVSMLGCQNAEEPDSSPIPPPGPHFTYSPVPVETLARITPLGYNNKIFPVSHTYWLTCDRTHILPGSRPCHLERQTIIAPGDGKVRDVNPATDGFLSIEGPPGLIWTFGHVTPAPGLEEGSSILAGQVIAAMFYEHGFDLGVTNYGVQHTYITPERYPDEPLHGQHPIEQFPEPLKTELLSRVVTYSDPLGRLSYDVAGTASGGWFIEGSPRTTEPLSFGNEHMLLWLGRYVERMETRIVIPGELWPGQMQRLLAVDAAAPPWEDISPASGKVALPLWEMGTDALPDTTSPYGTLLVELTGPTTLRAEWFNTHGPVTEFGATTRTYER